MTKEDLETIRRALQQYRGDDLERATSAFRACTPDQMEQEYGQSGQTRQEILTGYQQHVKRVESALRALDSEAVTQ